MSDSVELLPPTSDPAASEVLRVWVTPQEMFMNLRVGMWPDPAVWGILIVDLVRHIAAAYEKDKGTPVQLILKRIWDMVEAERQLPTDSPSGQLYE